MINNHVPLVEYRGSTDRVRRECQIPAAAVILFYAGGLYEDGSRRIDTVIKSLPQLPSTHLVVLGFMNDDIHANLEATARRLDVTRRFHIIPACPPSEVYEYAASADIGVIPLWGNNLNVKMSALNKVSEYLMAGLPIACSSYPNLEDIVRHNPVGVVGETFDVLSPRLNSCGYSIDTFAARQRAFSSECAVVGLSILELGTRKKKTAGNVRDYSSCLTSLAPALCRQLLIDD